MWHFGIQTHLSDRVARLESTQDRPSLEPLVDQHAKEIERLRSSQADVAFQLGGMLTELKDLKLAVAEGIERVDRAERRIKATVASAQKKLAESGLADERLNAEADGLQLVDGAGSEEQRVPAVPEEVAEDKPTASSIPGVTLEQLRRARGYG